MRMCNTPRHLLSDSDLCGGACYEFGGLDYVFVVIMKLNYFRLLFACCFLGVLEFPVSAIPTEYIADLLFIFDMVPHDAEVKGGQVSDAGGANTMMHELRRLPINETNMRFAIVISGKKGLPKLHVKFSERPNALALALPDQLSLEDGSKHDPKDVIAEALIEALKETNGHRPQVPKIIIYVGIYPKRQSIDDFRRDVDNTFFDKYKVLTKAAIALITPGFENHAMAVTRRRGSKYDSTGSMGTKMAGYIYGWTGGAESVLRDCNTQEYKESRQCYYDNAKKCVFERTYSSSWDSPFCLNGTIVWKCPSGEQKCDEECQLSQTWPPCDCATKTQNLKVDRTGKYYKNCEPVYERTCTTPPCTTPAPPIYTLVMPVWAVFFVTFCVFLIVVVVQTVCIYFCCFPVGWEDPVLSSRGRGPMPYRRPHQRFADSVVTLMQSFRPRRPMSSVSRGGPESYQPTDQRGRPTLPPRGRPLSQSGTRR